MQPALNPLQHLEAAHEPLVFHVKPVFDLTDQQVFELCQANREWRIERNAQGELIAMPPVGGATSEENAEITRQLGNWARTHGGGRTFDSSAGFVLPDGAIRSPDAAWVRTTRLESLTPAQRKGFVPLCPDFVIELKSPSDSLGALQEKMEEYIRNGAQLGWLLDPEARRVYVYRPGAPVEGLDHPTTLAGDDRVLPGFTLDLSEVWPR
jgi:Uma2 family endonuclease